MIFHLKIIEVPIIYSNGPMSNREGRTKLFLLFALDKKAQSYKLHTKLLTKLPELTYLHTKHITAISKLSSIYWSDGKEIDYSALLPPEKCLLQISSTP